MLRQRIRLAAQPGAGAVARVLVALLAVGLIWYGAMLLLLALKVSGSTVDSLSGYRDAYDYLAGLTAPDVDATARIVAAVVGLTCAAVFGLFAWRSLPRPHLARTSLTLTDDDLGRVEVSPRAIERAAEMAALEVKNLTGARARYTQEAIELDVGVSRATDLTSTLAAARERAADSLFSHQLPKLPVSVTLARFDRRTRRELQ